VSSTFAIFSCVVGYEVAVDASAGFRCAAVACSRLTEAADDDEGAILQVEGAVSARGAVRLAPAVVVAAALVERAALAVALVERRRRIGGFCSDTKDERERVEVE
jgi:hypothetical protein